MANVTEIIQQIETILNTIGSRNERLETRVAEFITNEIIDQDDDSSYELALQYAQWALAKPELAMDEELITWDHSCYKGSKWNFDKSAPPNHPRVIPCDYCRSEQYDFWKSGFIEDSDQLPR